MPSWQQCVQCAWPAAALQRHAAHYAVERMGIRNCILLIIGWIRDGDRCKIGEAVAGKCLAGVQEGSAGKAKLVLLERGDILKA